MTEPLKPCPFCGRKKGLSVKRTEINKEFNVAKYHVKCPNCYTQGPDDYNAVKCVEAWNKRI